MIKTIFYYIILDNSIHNYHLIFLASYKFFDFSINTDISNANNLEYSIILVKNEELSTALDENVKIYLEKEVSGSYSEVTGPIVYSSNMKDDKYENAMTIYKGTNKNNKTEEFILLDLLYGKNKKRDSSIHINFSNSCVN